MKTAAATFEWGDELPRLEGERLVLRQMRESDAEDVFAIFGDDEVIRYWSSPAHGSIDDARELISDTRKQFEARTMFEWGAALKENDRVIATFSLLNVDMPHRRAEVGYALNREYWGGGYATEGFDLLVAFAFGPLNLHRLEADVHPENAGSFRLLEKNGFKQEGYLRERWHHLGRIEDGVYLGLLRPEWLALKGIE
ncbi:MAG: GNAT family N-acetyltransferase [Acidobacteriota bacterium]|nr:MAG: GNAT family N-acetyltransferase [Acidobacteriota bacterium]